MKVLGILLLAFLGYIVLMLFLGALPKLIARVSDPPRMKRIRQFFEAAGCTDIEIKPWPNHYGVRYSRDGSRHYAKCRVQLASDRMEWVGRPPAWVAGGQSGSTGIDSSGDSSGDEDS